MIATMEWSNPMLNTEIIRDYVSCAFNRISDDSSIMTLC